MCRSRSSGLASKRMKCHTERSQVHNMGHLPDGLHSMFVLNLEGAQSAYLLGDDTGLTFNEAEMSERP